jgi:hypothetical protein
VGYDGAEALFGEPCVRALLSPLTRAAVLAAALLAAACGGGTEVEEIGPGLDTGALAPDFSLPDVNPGSPTYTTLVSPRQRLGKISAWYFAHAT